MSKKSDDSIERIFRQALTQYETTFREDDWLKMEKMLTDEANRKAAMRSKKIRGTAYLLTGLTGLIIAVYFLAFKTPSSSVAKLNDSTKKEQAIEDLSKTQETNNVRDSAGLLSSPPSQEPKANEASDLRTLKQQGAAQAKKLNDTNEIKIDNLKTPREIIGVDAKERSSSDKSRSAHANDSQTTKNATTYPAFNLATSKIRPNTQKVIAEPALVEIKKQLTPDNSRGAEENLTLNNSEEKSGSFLNPNSNIQQNEVESLNDKPRSVMEIGNVTDSTGISKHIDPTFADATTKQEAQPSVPVVSNEPIKKDSLDDVKSLLVTKKDSSEIAAVESAAKKKNKPSARFSIGIIYSPEFSTTKLNSYSSPGGSFGLRIGYQISNRFSVHTGLIRSNKKYIGKGSDYSPRNPAYWRNRTNGIIPEEIDSECLVYELPVGVQFDAIQTQKSRVFLSTAVASYFMISQAYDYKFEGPNPGAETGWRSPGSESYWFSIAMFTAGYERNISSSVALGIEPYLKVSLTEIGWPNVKLFSTGAYLTLRYKFLNRN